MILFNLKALFAFKLLVFFFVLTVAWRNRDPSQCKAQFKSFSLKSSRDFMSDQQSAYSNKIKNKNENIIFETWASINKGGLFNSFDVYTSHRDTQPLIIGQISNWMQAESYGELLPKSSSHSCIFASLDGERVVHNIGWKIEEKLSLGGAFRVLSNRATTCEGAPVGLKERYKEKVVDKNLVKAYVADLYVHY
mmetsp:Transcript_40253/g.41057  ORF Transcript_40253/g.41057 Transcript_40253/m.41057 type:complete len:193 (+) Transcript_40253:138-716(+)